MSVLICWRVDDDLDVLIVSLDSSDGVLCDVVVGRNVLTDFFYVQVWTWFNRWCQDSRCCHFWWIGCSPGVFSVAFCLRKPQRGQPDVTPTDEWEEDVRGDEW
jgi:hypothetical protein